MELTVTAVTATATALLVNILTLILLYYIVHNEINKFIQNDKNKKATNNEYYKGGVVVIS